MIEVYKILTNKYDSRVNLYLEKQQDSITRGHSLKLVNNKIYDLRKFSFASRIVVGLGIYYVGPVGAVGW